MASSTEVEGDSRQRNHRGAWRRWKWCSQGMSAAPELEAGSEPSPRASWASMALLTPWFEPRATDFWLVTSRTVKGKKVCFKPPSLWRLVTTALGKYHPLLGYIFKATLDMVTISVPFCGLEMLTSPSHTARIHSQVFITQQSKLFTTLPQLTHSSEHQLDMQSCAKAKETAGS